MIEFYKFEPQFGMRDASPFCLKLMTYLRLAKIPHKTIEMMDPRKAPKQKMPFIIDGGVTIGDSELIIAHLKEAFGDPLGEGLSAEQIAMGHAFNVMMAERFYWAGMLCPRWLDKEHQPKLSDAWFSTVPRPLRGIVTSKVFKDTKKAAVGHGIGRHSGAEWAQFAVADIEAVEACLGEKDFFLDDQPREIDATLYAFLINATCEAFPCAANDRIRESSRLMAYIDRVDGAAFGKDVGL